PASPRERSAPFAASPGDGWRGSGALLVVEDEPALRRMTAGMLVGAGFRVLTAADGREALALFRAHRHEVRAVLLDLTMPGVSGSEVLSALRALDPDVRVVICSGYSEVEVCSRLDAIPDAVLLKPFRPRELLARLREVLERPRGATPRRPERRRGSGGSTDPGAFEKL
ncbi:MAG TPA: response regulator, partial [Myxococcota bacterium]|nr:response regulator [Myxococcota bacterium]